MDLLFLLAFFALIFIRLSSKFFFQCFDFIGFNFFDQRCRLANFVPFLETISEKKITTYFSYLKKYLYLFVLWSKRKNTYNFFVKTTFFQKSKRCLKNSCIYCLNNFVNFDYNFKKSRFGSEKWFLRHGTLKIFLNIPDESLIFWLL